MIEIWEALPEEENIHEHGRSNPLGVSKPMSSSGLEIADVMMCSEELVETEDDDRTVEEKVVSYEEGQRAWSTVRKFMEQRSGKPGEIQACDRLDNQMHLIHEKKIRQPTILERFEPINNLRK
ncbi:hypothetical protein RF11_06787 [Thelohanellus kitauei]|uniref:Uncharacterized protein n=1 Tax=Thelohanellus kitauei TaxID=669202 RepID=A0A0C2JGI2_THEKT|nr:hypothetical protein RF11_06787 [Thelohanellus kitauei]